MSFYWKLVLFGGFLCVMGAFYGCKSAKGVFSDEERRIIHAGGSTGIMRLYTVDDSCDSALLRRNSEPVTEKLFSSPDFTVLAERMLATVKNPDNEGVGIAAPQVGILRRVVAVQRFDKKGEPFEIYVNPEIISYSDKKVAGTEGCLSVPGMRGVVSRAEGITLRYRDGVSFAERVEEVSGFTAVIFQHEIDHLNGRLYIDIASEMDTVR